MTCGTHTSCKKCSDNGEDACQCARRRRKQATAVVPATQDVKRWDPWDVRELQHRLGLEQQARMESQRQYREQAEVLAEAQGRIGALLCALEKIVAELDDEDGSMGVSVDESAPDEIATAVYRRTQQLFDWTRRYIMGEEGLSGEGSAADLAARREVQQLRVENERMKKELDQLAGYRAATKAFEAALARNCKDTPFETEA